MANLFSLSLSSPFFPPFSHHVSGSWKCTSVCTPSRGNKPQHHLTQTALAYARVWHHVDASDRILGKLAERIALVLMGKHKPIYDPGGKSLSILRINVLT